MPRFQCDCGAVDCPSCGPAQGWHVHTARCVDADGAYACGKTTYGEDDIICGWCGAPSAADICATCQEEYETTETE